MELLEQTEGVVGVVVEARVLNIVLHLYHSMVLLELLGLEVEVGEVLVVQIEVEEQMEHMQCIV
jgi:hypothetical protein